MENRCKQMEEQYSSWRLGRSNGLIHNDNEENKT